MNNENFLIPVTFNGEVVGYSDGSGTIKFLSDELRDKVLGHGQLVGVSSRKRGELDGDSVVEKEDIEYSIIKNKPMENFDLDKFKNYVNTYDQQVGHENYSIETVINDFLYGIGICLDEGEFSNADGFRKFKALLISHLNAAPNNKRSGKCYCGEPVDESNPDCVAFNLCRGHAMEA